MSRSLSAEIKRLTEHGDAFMDGDSDRGSIPLASILLILDNLALELAQSGNMSGNKSCPRRLCPPTSGTSSNEAIYRILSPFKERRHFCRRQFARGDRNVAPPWVEVTLREGMVQILTEVIEICACGRPNPMSWRRWRGMEATADWGAPAPEP